MSSLVTQIKRRQKPEVDRIRQSTIVTCPPYFFPHAVYTVQPNSSLSWSCLHHDQLADRVHSTLSVIRLGGVNIRLCHFDAITPAVWHMI